MAFVIPEPPRATIPVEGTHELFPVRRIFCVGRNYAEHAREMGGDPNREPPFFFTKPAGALDMTRRDLQAEAKRLARPWDMTKGFDESCPISALRPAAFASTALRGELKLSVNGEMRQRGDLSDMIWSPGECLAVLSTLVELRPGDLLLTGTPAGVGAVAAGDILEAKCALAPALQVQYLGLEARSA
jgi:fumarylpyruvate hydrolase